MCFPSQSYQHEGLFSQAELAPGFASPPPQDMSYDDYVKYVDASMPQESPLLLGLHGNAELGFLNSSVEKLFFSILQMGGSGGDAGADDVTKVVRGVMKSIQERLPEEFQIVKLQLKAKPLLEGPSGPFVVVALQECGRMNTLLSEIRRSISDLDKGLNGQLNMSQAMEDLAAAFVLNQWPGR